MHLILGGARSGKSRYAEELASEYKQVLYIATAQANDAEMKQRIIQHQNQRSQHWSLIEEPFELAQILSDLDPKIDCVLIECMTLWLSNWLCSPQAKQWNEQKSQFLSALKSNAACAIYIVSNEVGSGIVPLGELSRKFADEAGWLNQALAKLASEVTLVVAGCELKLKTVPCESSGKNLRRLD
ncbi:bifunctional adenosylcobinamide kinase/adenosylcobinamide-phosphate guanylyltransferase [Aliikangiella sp. IMCC44632]